VEQERPDADDADDLRSMYGDDIRPPVSIAGMVAALGGAVIAAATLFELVSASIGADGNQLTASQSYIDTDDGKVVAALGVIVLVVALATLVRPARSIAWPIVVTACSLGALGLAIYDWIDLDDAGDQMRERLGTSVAGVVHVTIGPAVYIAMAGGVIATIAAVLASRDR
jgi:hypothetical protein